jgi:hypothetical protein
MVQQTENKDTKKKVEHYEDERKEVIGGGGERINTRI